MAAAVTNFLTLKTAQSQSVSQELAGHWNEIDSLYSRRLWHQLTVKLLEFVHHETFASGGLIELYHNLIKDIEDRIKPLSLVTILQKVIEEIEDDKDAIAFLEPIKEKVKLEPLAITRINTTVAELLLHSEQIEEAEKLLKECEKVINDDAGVTPTHADYYKVAATMQQIKGNYAGFYAEALRYLGCVDVDTLSAVEKAERAFDLGLAALLGKGIYNIGELIQHEILDALKGTDKQWLIDLLLALNCGDVARFKELLCSAKESSPDLAANEDLLLEKIKLLAVMEVVFNRGSGDKVVEFSVIAEAAEIPVGEVEILVMKALSLGLVKGTINQIEGVIEFTWVQPRVLSMEQLTNMRDMLNTWLGKVDEATEMIASGVPTHKAL